MLANIFIQLPSNIETDEDLADFEGELSEKLEQLGLRIVDIQLQKELDYAKELSHKKYL
jgi:hypothetical protein